MELEQNHSQNTLSQNTLSQYRQYIRQLLSDRAQRSTQYRNEPEYEIQTLFDSEHDHYQLLHVGWRNQRRTFNCILHLDIKQGKIWIQHDGTEIGIANQLVELGVPKHDIILAFHEPEVRQYTDFGIGDGGEITQAVRAGSQAILRQLQQHSK